MSENMYKELSDFILGCFLCFSYNLFFVIGRFGHLEIIYM